MSDVGTTKRTKLSPTQRLALFERRNGICYVCHQKIIGSFIDEHVIPCGLGGSNDPSNRDIAHPKCAADKTRQDMRRINKAKAQKKAAHGIKKTDRRLIPSPPKQETPRRKKMPKRQKDVFGRRAE